MYGWEIWCRNGLGFYPNVWLSPGSKHFSHMACSHRRQWQWPYLHLSGWTWLSRMFIVKCHHWYCFVEFFWICSWYNLLQSWVNQDIQQHSSVKAKQRRLQRSPCSGSPFASKRAGSPQEDEKNQSWLNSMTPKQQGLMKGSATPSTPIRGRGGIESAIHMTHQQEMDLGSKQSNPTALEPPPSSCPLQGVWHGSVLMVYSTSNAISVQYKLVPISFGTITAKHPQTTWYTQDVQVTSVPSPKKSPHWPPCCYHALITPWSSLVALTAQSSWINPLLSLNHCG